MTENEISYLIRNAIFKVYNTLKACNTCKFQYF